MSLSKIVLLISYSSMKKKLEWFPWFLTQKIEFDSQNFAIFTARFLIVRWSAKALLQRESAIYHSIKLGFEGQGAKKFLNGIHSVCMYMIFSVQAQVRSSCWCSRGWNVRNQSFCGGLRQLLYKWFYLFLKSFLKP